MVSAVLLFQHRPSQMQSCHFRMFSEGDWTTTQIKLLLKYAQGDPSLLCKESSAFLIVDLTFHGQWHICQFRCQPSCSGKFASLWSHSCLSNRTIKPVEVVKARCQNCSSMLCLLFWAFCAQISTPKAAVQHFQPCRCIASSFMNRLGQRRKLSAACDAA